MRIDFASTKTALIEMLNNAISSFRSQHPGLQIKKLTLWGIGFLQVAKVSLETTDDDAVFGGKHGEYIENEFGPGIAFAGWPNFYDYEEGEKHELLMPDGTIKITDPERDGDEAINQPLFELLKEVLSEANLDEVPKATPFLLCAENGSSGCKTEWNYGTSPPASYDYVEQVRIILVKPERFDDGTWMFTEIIDGEIVPMMWEPDAEEEKRFVKAIAAIDWSDFKRHEVRY